MISSSCFSLRTTSLLCDLDVLSKLDNKNSSKPPECMEEMRPENQHLQLTLLEKYAGTLSPRYVREPSLAQDLRIPQEGILATIPLLLNMSDRLQKVPQEQSPPDAEMSKLCSFLDTLHLNNEFKEIEINNYILNSPQLIINNGTLQLKEIRNLSHSKLPSFSPSPTFPALPAPTPTAPSLALPVPSLLPAPAPSPALPVPAPLAPAPIAFWVPRGTRVAARMNVPAHYLTPEFFATALGREALSIAQKAVATRRIAKTAREYLMTLSRQSGGTCLGQSNALMIAHRFIRNGDRRALIGIAEIIHIQFFQILEHVAAQARERVIDEACGIRHLRLVPKDEVSRKMRNIAERTLIRKARFTNVKKETLSYQDPAFTHDIIRALRSENSHIVEITMFPERGGGHSIVLFLTGPFQIYDPEHENLGLFSYSTRDELIQDVLEYFRIKGSQANPLMLVSLTCCQAEGLRPHPVTAAGAGTGAGAGGAQT